jgi:hypothetical protein
MSDLVEKIVRYEHGDMPPAEEVDFFKELVETGMVWQLQGHYGRKAHTLIDQGLVEAPSDWKVFGNHDYRGYTSQKDKDEP